MHVYARIRPPRTNVGRPRRTLPLPPPRRRRQLLPPTGNRRWRRPKRTERQNVQRQVTLGHLDSFDLHRLDPLPLIAFRQTRFQLSWHLRPICAYIFARTTGGEAKTSESKGRYCCCFAPGQRPVPGEQGQAEQRQRHTKGASGKNGAFKGQVLHHCRTFFFGQFTRAFYTPSPHLLRHIQSKHDSSSSAGWTWHRRVVGES